MTKRTWNISHILNQTNEMIAVSMKLFQFPPSQKLSTHGCTWVSNHFGSDSSPCICGSMDGPPDKYTFKCRGCFPRLMPRCETGTLKGVI